MPFVGKGTLLLHLDGRIGFASTFFCDLVGVEVDKAQEASVFDFVLPEHIEDFKAQLDAQRHPDAPPFTAVLRKSDNTSVLTEINASPLKTAAGELYGFSATVTTITDADERTPISRQRRRRNRGRFRMTGTNACVASVDTTERTVTTRDRKALAIR